MMKKKAREIRQLRYARNEAIEDAAYWYIQGNHTEYLKAIYRATEFNNALIMRRRRFF